METVSREQLDFENALIDFEKAQAPKPKTLTDLSWIARQITALERRIAMTQKYRAIEVERIASCAGDIIEKKQAQIDSLTIMAMNFLKTEGYCYDNKKLRTFHLEGIGKFAFSTSRESVNADDYNDFDDGKTEAWHIAHKNFSVTNVRVTANKTLIMSELKDGKKVPGFRINQKQETFKFKEE